MMTLDPHSNEWFIRGTVYRRGVAPTIIEVMWLEGGKVDDKGGARKRGLELARHVGAAPTEPLCYPERLPSLPQRAIRGSICLIPCRSLTRCRNLKTVL